VRIIIIYYSSPVGRTTHELTCMHAGFLNMNASWAIAFDFCTDRNLNIANPACQSRETRMHYLSQPNSISTNNATLQTQVLRSTLYFPNQLNDGFDHTVLIRYFGKRPDWIEVYIDNSLYLQQRGIALDTVLGGREAWAGFTAGTGPTANEASNIFIKDFTINTVAIADANTRPYNLPNETMSAVADGHHTINLTVQNFDKCDNVIQYGGYASRGAAFLIPSVPTLSPTTSGPSSR